MRLRSAALWIVVSLLSETVLAQQAANPLAPYVKESGPVVVLDHVRVIDGTGTAPQEDMRIDIEGGKITRATIWCGWAMRSTKSMTNSCAP